MQILMRVMTGVVLAGVFMGAGCSSMSGGSTAGRSRAGADVRPVGDQRLEREYRLAWADEFDGSAVDEGVWQYRTDSKMWSTQKPENVVVEGGRLKILLKKEAAQGKEYTGGGVITKGEFKHGYYECRIKMPRAAGWHTSFWMMKYDGVGTGVGPRAQEIDVVEHDSVAPRKYGAGLHDWSSMPGTSSEPEYKVHKEYGRHHVEAEVSLAEGFHVYGCEFTPQMVRFYRDGVLTGEAEISAFVHKGQNIWITCIATHLGGATRVEDEKLPDAVEVEYVRVFERVGEVK